MAACRGQLQHTIWRRVPARHPTTPPFRRCAMPTLRPCASEKKFIPNSYCTDRAIEAAVAAAAADVVAQCNGCVALPLPSFNHVAMAVHLVADDFSKLKGSGSTATSLKFPSLLQPQQLEQPQPLQKMTPLPPPPNVDENIDAAGGSFQHAPLRHLTGIFTPLTGSVSSAAQEAAVEPTTSCSDVEWDDVPLSCWPTELP